MPVQPLSTGMGQWNIQTGDVLEVSSTLSANTFDACFCDPPYALEFMNRDWDRCLPGVEVWREILRICKPGAWLLAFGGTRTFHRLACNIEDAGWTIRDCVMWLHSMGFPKSLDLGKADEQWDGYGTALKPAWEPVIVAMRPVDGTFAANCANWGCGGLNIDGCRIGENPGYRYNTNRNGTTFHGQQGDRIKQTAEKAGKDWIESTKGRWPANVVLDETTEEMLGERSRFFYCAKASKRDRAEYNDHPTVKPLRLCEWLAQLILPPATETPRRLLVPYAGSGSEMLGALAAGWDDVLGIELNPEYAAIAERRLATG